MHLFRMQRSPDDKNNSSGETIIDQSIERIAMDKNKTISFFVQGSPVAWHRSGQNRHTGVTFKVKADVIWQRHIRTQAILHRPNIMPTGPVFLNVIFFMPRPKYHKPGVNYVHTKRPDLDNLIKNVKDALTKSMYKDDSQVVEEHLRKIFAKEGSMPGVLIDVTYLSTDTDT